jgi:hypothetical protein
MKKDRRSVAALSTPSRIDLATRYLELMHLRQIVQHAESIRVPLRNLRLSRSTRSDGIKVRPEV